MNSSLPSLTSGLEHLHGRFHAHLTVAPREGLETFARQHKLKQTVIELRNGSRSQRDVMLTEYFRDSSPGAVSRIANRLQERVHRLTGQGFRVLRVKLEQEAGVQLTSFSKARYHEVHVKLRIPALRFAAVRGRLDQLKPWVPSTNPRERTGSHVIQFLNLRVYQGTTAQADLRVQDLVQRIQHLEIVQVRRETTLFDTHHALDAWWA